MLTGKIIPQKFGAVSANPRPCVRCFATTSTSSSPSNVRKTWAPGAEIPKHLDGHLPGDFGFDPLDLASEGFKLHEYRHAEILHGRWAMLGVVGVVAVELLGYGNWYDAATASPQLYFGREMLVQNFPTIAIAQAVIMYFTERRRLDNANVKGSSTGKEEGEFEKYIDSLLYPGGMPFDPMGLAKSPEQFERLKVAEVKHCRLAMAAMLGVYAQANSTHTTPMTNLFDHLADPFHNNVGNNLNAIPFLNSTMGEM